MNEVVSRLIGKASSNRKRYDDWAPFYDFTFSWCMNAGRKAIVESLSYPMGKVLDVGVGTGLELPLFNSAATIYGIDISVAMINRAHERVIRQGLQNVNGLYLMDAANLAFGDECFDTVIAPYVMSVVPHPDRVLSEMARVTRLGGEIILINHFGSVSGPMAYMERFLSKSSDKLGWRPDFSYTIVDNWIKANKNITLIEKKVILPLKLFTMIKLKKSATASPT